MALPVAVALSITTISGRFTRFKFTRIMPNLFIMRKAKHDQICSELRRRRTMALRWYAEPDPLLTTAEQISILSKLRDGEIISQNEYDALEAKTKLIQEAIGLDEPPAATAAQSSTKPATVH